MLWKFLNFLASQTNLLALNAAIQAAHAGEVRKLANQAEEATQEVHSSVEKINEQVQSISIGTKHSERTISESHSQIEQAVLEFNGIGEAARLLDMQSKVFQRTPFRLFFKMGSY